VRLNRLGGFGGAVAMALALGAVLGGGAGVVHGAELEVFVDIDDEDDLVVLLESGQISQASFDGLVELLRQGVDLDRADRDELWALPNLTIDDVDGILRYRAEAGRVGDPQNLVAAGVLSQEKLDAIAPFLRVAARGPGRGASVGRARLPVVALADRPDRPAVAILGRVETSGAITAGGAAVVTTNRLGDVVFDPVRRALSAEAPAPRAELPKLYVAWADRGVGLIVGSYRIGFGQRLTFDDTARPAPSGFIPDDDLIRGTSSTSACKAAQGELPASPCAGTAGDEYVVPDFRWREGLFGVAVRARDLAAGPGRLELDGFFSSARRPVYQYEIFDRGRCADPERDDDPACAAPAVYRTEADVLAPAPRFSYQTLPDLFRETTIGAHAALSRGAVSHVGVTGYVSAIDWLASGIELDFQEFSRYPRGGAFGAVGVDGGLRALGVDVYAEVSRSFDETPGGGGDFAALVRVLAAGRGRELEASLRWFGGDYVNPYARPISAPDESGGQRARDEAGLRLRYAGAFARRLAVRATWDLWVTPSTNTPKTALIVRTDTRVRRDLGIGLWLTFADKDLGQGGGPMTCYDVPFDEDETGEPRPCAGRKLALAARVRFAPSRRFLVAAQWQHALVDDPAYPDSARQDVSAWLEARFRASAATSLRFRSRFLDQDLADNTSLERSATGVFELAHRFGPGGRAARSFRLRAKTELVAWLDERVSTQTRQPSPELWLWLELEARF
jgi:hypothetical protein